MKTIICVALIFVAAVYAQECSVGETYKVDCNNCVCSTSGLLACTTIGCFPDKDLIRCDPGQVYENDCNECICVNGIFGCTQRSCNPKLFKRDVPQKCTPGETLKKDCNTCFCSPNDEFVCSNLDCTARPAITILA